MCLDPLHLFGAHRRCRFSSFQNNQITDYKIPKHRPTNQILLPMVSSPKLLLDAVRNPAGVRPAWVMKFCFGLHLEWRGIFTSGNLGLKNAVLPIVSSPKLLLDAIQTRTPPYSNGVAHRTLFHSKERGWLQTRPSLRLDVKSRLPDEV